MFNPRKLFMAIPLDLLLVACGGDNDDDDDNVTGGDPTGDLRIVHAVSDAPAVDVEATAGGSTSTPITGLDFAGTTGFLTLPATTYDFDVLANLPDGSTTSVLALPGLAVDEGQAATAVVVGTAAAGDSYDLEAVTFNPSASTPGSGEVSIVAAHASTAADAAASSGVDVYVTAPGTDVTATSPAFTFGYTDTVDATASGALPAGQYQIQITPEGSDTVVYDSGTVDLSPFAGAEIAIVAVNTVNQVEQSAAPVKLLAIVGGTIVELLDTDTQAGVKVAHVSPDAGDVDVTANGSGYLSGVPYLGVNVDASTYDELATGSYDLNVQAAGSGTDVLSSPVTAVLEAGTEYSVLALGNVADIGGTPATAFDLTPTVDDNRSIATQASVKIVHGAPAVGNVDVYVTPAGDFSTSEILNGAATPLLSDFPFRDVTDYVAVSAGDYDIRVVERSGGTMAINAEGVTLSNGDVITAIARQPDGVDGNPAGAGLLLLTN
ncbi:DUF4397 domain-containing protein [Ectothiorhodospiraceae bacterium WFHF3C12]|nr:DUF4397 domain-containing protein [Ectothiorhodospiraceae bacterium WFHF3C12]